MASLKVKVTVVLSPAERFVSSAVIDSVGGVWSVVDTPTSIFWMSLKPLELVA